MKNRDENDRLLRELFATARQADAAEAPAYGALLRRARGRAPRPATPWRLNRFAALGTAGSLVVVAAAAWLYVADPRQELPTAAPEPVEGASQTVAAADLVGEIERAGPSIGTPADLAGVESAAVPERPPVAEYVPPPVEPVHPPPAAVMSLAALEQSWTTDGKAQRSEEGMQRVSVVARPEVAELERIAANSKYSEEFIEDLPAPVRFYENVVTLAPGVPNADGGGVPNVHGSRQRYFKAEVSGVRNVDPLTGGYMGQVNPNSIEEMEVITAGKGVAFSRARGGVANIFEEPPDVEDSTGFNTESYDVIRENDFLTVLENPLSTFSIDVDTASYANVRRFLDQGRIPPPGAVRIEEMVNYFRYDYPPPGGSSPFSADVEIADCPWNPDHRLARIGLKGQEITRGETAGSNLVFLIDVSGSMQPPTKLPLLKTALRLLTEQLDGRDQVAIVVYAGNSGLVLPSTSGADRGAILDALESLGAGGSTNGGEGLRLAYRIARDQFIPGGVNRVILATDGDFNMGVTDKGELLRLIEKDAREGIFLTALGFGMDNYKDDTLELLADRGNGNYAYIDNLREARKVLVEEIGGTLVTIAKDVKIQVEFNPAQAAAYRLVGYENRMLRKEEFNDDRKDAGEIGAGHTVTALYEIVPPGYGPPVSPVDPLKYRAPAAVTEEARGGELLTLKIRYKEPDGRKSRLLEFPIVDAGLALDQASADFKFAAAVAQFGMILRDSEHKGGATLDGVRALALEGLGADERGYRGEFVDLVNRAASLTD